MKKKRIFTKILAVVGTIFVWLPVLAPVIFSTMRFIESGHFLFDYLMPAELFPVAFVGTLLLVWVSVRTRLHRKHIGWSLGVMLLSLVVGQLIATITGLASGKTEPTGYPWALVVSSLIIYSISLVSMGVGGILVLRDLFAKHA